MIPIAWMYSSKFSRDMTEEIPDGYKISQKDKQILTSSRVEETASLCNRKLQ